MTLDLDTFGARAEAFLTDLDREYHLHFSGQKPEYEVEEVYARHGGLFDREAVEALREAAGGGDEEETKRRATYLLGLVVGGYMGRETAAEAAALAEREAQLELEVDGERIPYRSARPVQANEADPERRRRVEDAQLELLEAELTPLHREMFERSHSLIEGLGWKSYGEAYEELLGIDLTALGAQTEKFLAATDSVYEEIVSPELERVLGFGLAEARRSDLPYFFRATGFDHAFGGERLMPLFSEAMSALGLDLERRPNIILDTEARPTKSPRAYCAPVRVPDEVYLVVPRVGGREDFLTLFHEAGHAQHYGSMDVTLPVEYRYLGDNTVTESFAFLFEHITEDPLWIEERLGADPAPIASHVRAVRLYFLRRYAAKISYELELHAKGADLAAMPERYAKRLGDATGVEWPQATWLDDVDSGFYVASYLRAWALEDRWWAGLRERFGERWWGEPDAGRWLTGIWRGGPRLRGDELLADATGVERRFDARAADVA